MCIEDQNEELSSELVSLQDVPIPASIISSLANQGMYKVLYKIITLKRKMDTNENSYGTSKYFSLQQEDLDSHAVEKKEWNLTEILYVALKKDVEEEALRPLMILINEYDEEAIKLLLKKKKEKLAFILVKKKHLVKSADILGFAIEHKCGDFSAKYIKLVGNHLHGDFDSLFRKIIDVMKTEFHFWTFLIFVMKTYVRYMPAHNAEIFIEYIGKTIDEDDENFTIFTINPLRICVSLYELVYIIGSKFSSISLRCADLCENLSKLAVCITDKIKNEQAIVDLFKDTDFEGRDVIGMCCDLNLNDLFQNKHVEKLANMVWNGTNEEYDYFFQPASSLWKLVKFSTDLKHDFEENARKETYIRDLKQFAKHRMQFTCWYKGIHFRFIIEFMISFISLIGAYACIQVGLNTVLTLMSLLKPCGYFTCSQDVLLQTTGYLNSFQLQMNGILPFIFLAVIYPLHHVMRLIYSLMVSHKFYIDYVQLVVDIVLCAIGIAYLQIYFLRQLNFEEPGQSTMEMLNSLNNFTDQNFPVVLAILILFLSLRTMLFFVVNYYIGPFMKCVQVIVASIWHFAIVYVSLLLVFSLICTLFNSIYFDPKFIDMETAIFTLFQSALGIYDLNALPDNLVLKLIYVLYIIIFSLIFLNMLIAILTHVYVAYKDKGTGLYFAEIFKIREIYALDPEKDYMTHSFFPLSLILFLLIEPISMLLNTSCKQKLNKAILFFEYSIAYLFALAFFICVESILFPIAYLKCLTHKILLACRSSDGTTRTKLANVFIFFFFGSIILLGNFLADIFYFTKHCFIFEEVVVRTSALQEKTDPPRKIYYDFISYIKKEKEEKILLEKIENEIRELVGAKSSNVFAYALAHSKTLDSQNASKFFILCSLIMFIKASGTEETLGKPHVLKQELLQLLLENVTIPRLFKKFHKKIKEPEGKIVPLSDISGSKAKNIISPSKPHFDQACKEPKKISMHLLRLHNHDSMMHAILSMKSTNDVIISQTKKVNKKLNLLVDNMQSKDNSSFYSHL